MVKQDDSLHYIRKAVLYVLYVTLGSQCHGLPDGLLVFYTPIS